MSDLVDIVNDVDALLDLFVSAFSVDNCGFVVNNCGFVVVDTLALLVVVAPSAGFCICTAVGVEVGGVYGILPVRVTTDNGALLL